MVNNYPAAHMCSRVQKNSAVCIILLIVKFKCLQSGFLCPASYTDGAIVMRVLIKGPGILHYDILWLIMHKGIT